MQGKWICLTVLPLLFTVKVNCDSDVERFLTLSLSEKLALDKFKEKVLGKIKLTHNFMKEDVNLIRWLRAAHFNVDQAERMLKANLEWRKTNKVDTIMSEDWSEFQERFPYTLTSHARNGEPIFMGNIGEWDLRAAALAGEIPRLIRYQVRVAEEMLALLIKEMMGGKNVTQVHFLANLDGYAVIQHGCPQCIPFYIAMATQYENYYPNFVKNIILINAPPIFEVVLKAVRPFTHPITKKSMKVFGLNKKVWKKTLFSLVDPKDLLPEFGGTYVP